MKKKFSSKYYKYAAIGLIIIIACGILYVVIKDLGILKRPEKYNAIGEDVNYFENVSGYIAKPIESRDFPGVVMIHEWWGLNDHIRATARQLASEGYIVLAVDLYDGEVATTPERARELTSSLDQARAIKNMKSAVAYLKVNEGITKIASLGWCFGGAQSLQLALSGEVLDATIIYYGNLVTDESKLSLINWPVLGVFGDQDAVIPITEVKKFESSLNALGIKNEIYIYSGVGHAFANPSGANYAQEETKDAWEKTVAFLNENLK